MLAAVLPAPAQARGSVAVFSTALKECVAAGHVSFGPNGRWPSCRMVKSHWVATIGLLDFYQAQYCLGGGGGGCEQRALLLFSNRAYNRAARLVLQRIDPGDTEYGDPLVVQSGEDSLLVVSASAPGAAETREHYLWRDNRWMPVEARSWLRDLAPRLPRGASVRAGVTPEAETMSARVPLYRQGDADCCPSGGVAHVELGVAGGRFTVRAVTVAATDE
jgi:hypothetical protein